MDIKLLMGILAFLLNPLVPSLVDLDQTGFIPTTPSGIMHILDKAQRSERELMLLSIDTEKASTASMVTPPGNPGALQLGTPVPNLDNKCIQPPEGLSQSQQGDFGLIPGWSFTPCCFLSTWSPLHSM
ncbi:hypothetical protein NDU88_006814 [Pleurodeles waltl]|uniref:Uncharacterized protein n=1 Tax=Pleurodeles waltl TaxID=8319 RepID=A0AAV7UM40_PLEWA|nr:hypothetical protein NDU88_006814 [Pleurodeles waltl]